MDIRDEINFAEVAKTMHIAKIMAQALPLFYEKTQLTAELTFGYNHIEKGMVFNIGFAPRAPTKKEWNCFIEQIFDAEKVLICNSILNSIEKFDNLSQLVFKYKEDLDQVILRRKNE